ncbi:MULTISPECIES: flagellar hook-length control protein FliK [unclassified Xanthobacter]|uniref:flagellar hook-length control protein FliK n=1 Tax=unclassified Xanthobacter TaxID=2623496 RepID=UPI001EDEAC8D
MPDLPHSPSAEARPGEAPTGHSGTAVRATVLHRETHFAPVTPGRPAGVSIPEPATSDRPDTSDIAIDAPEPRHPTPAPRADVEPPSTSTAASPAPMGAWLGATPAPALPQVSLAQVGAAITQEARRLQAGRPADANDGAQMRGPVRVLEMALSPESLGRVVIRLRLTAGGLDVRIRASLPETARMLEQDRGHLARLMADQGLELNDLQLETGPSLGRFGTAGFVPEPPRFEPPGFEPPRANDQSAADQSPDDNGRRRDPRDPPPQDQPHQDPADEDPARRP